MMIIANTLNFFQQIFKDKTLESHEIEVLRNCINCQNIIEIQKFLKTDKIVESIDVLDSYAFFVSISEAVKKAVTENNNRYAKAIAMDIICRKLLEFESSLYFKGSRVRNNFQPISRSWLRIIEEARDYMMQLWENDESIFPKFFFDTSIYYDRVNSIREWKYVIRRYKEYFGIDNDIYKCRQNEKVPEIYGLSLNCVGKKTLGDYFDENNIPRI